MNLMALGLIQGKLNLVLWPDYVDVGDAATCQNLSLVLLGGGKAPRLSEAHYDRDSVCED